MYIYIYQRQLTHGFILPTGDPRTFILDGKESPPYLTRIIYHIVPNPVLRLGILGKSPKGQGW